MERFQVLIFSCSSFSRIRPEYRDFKANAGKPLTFIYLFIYLFNTLLKYGALQNRKI